ncbi:hypothetical protein ACWGOQ_0021565 [Aquimarina sp. M1]
MEKKKAPIEWKQKIIYLLNYYLFFILAAVVANILIHFRLVSQDNKFLVYGILGILALLVFSSNKKVILNYLKKNDLSKNYKRSKLKELAGFLMLITSSLVLLALFILSFRIQNYI